MIRVECSNCNKNINAPDKYAGKTAKCPSCGSKVLIPKTALAAPENSAAAQQADAHPTNPQAVPQPVLPTQTELPMPTDPAPANAQSPATVQPISGQTVAPLVTPNPVVNKSSIGIDVGQPRTASSIVKGRKSSTGQKILLGSLCLILVAFFVGGVIFVIQLGQNDTLASANEEKKTKKTEVKKIEPKKAEPAEPETVELIPPTFKPLKQVSTQVNKAVSVQLEIDNPNEDEELVYSLVGDKNSDASIAPNGMLTWTPKKTDAGAIKKIVVAAALKSNPEIRSETKVWIEVAKMAPIKNKDDGKLAINNKINPDSDFNSGNKQLTQQFKNLSKVYKDKRLFNRKTYPLLRKYYASQFEAEHADTLKKVSAGTDLAKWFEEHTDIKEEFFNAINPDHDNVPKALDLFTTIYKTFPDQIVPYAGLAIAISVTWDKERPGVYDYVSHQRRTGSVMPADRLGAIENFDFFVQAESVMQGRARMMPWEFLTLLVNHKTPLIERKWSLVNYGGNRQMFGKCYKDVPYDMQMLETKSRVCKLQGKEYSLANIRDFGGVCAMQADFAARVGKNLGIPAAYVGGASIYGENHAWVMWVEVKNVTQTSIAFSLESYGRYRGDKYYVGNLVDPQTGQRITDRDLELRLHSVGMDAVAKRHADLAMKIFPELSKAEQFSTADKFKYLREVLKVSPGNEQAWYALAEMASSPEVRENHIKEMRKVLDGLFKTFANFPDFTWKVFEKLIQFEEDEKKQLNYLARIVGLYESAGRPDLGCQAVLSLSQRLMDSGESLAAINGLASSIKKFPEEGRYVPQMLDRMEKICGTDAKANEQLLNFYGEFLPLIPQKRGNRPSEYCIKMYKRGITKFSEAGRLDFAQRLQLELAKIQNGAN